MKILLIEDDAEIANLLVTALTAQHYSVELASDGFSGWEMARAFAFDLVLLEINLPKIDGISLCRKLREQNSCLPMLLMTAQDCSIKQATGADDYIIKPFELEELLAKIRAILRRSSFMVTPLSEWESLCLDPSNSTVTYSEIPLNLTPKEYELIELFLRNPQRIYSSSALFDRLWSLDEPLTENTVRTYIKTLQSKLKNAGAETDLIETIYGLGYRLKSQASAATSQRSETETLSIIPQHLASKSHDFSQPSSSQPEPPSAMVLPELLAIWERAKDRYCDRITVIDQAIHALLVDRLTPELQKQARQQAHTLAGSLGSFGFPLASELARAIEYIFQHPAPRDRAQIDTLQHLALGLRREIEAPLPTTTSLTPIALEPKFRLLMVGSDPALTFALTQEASVWSIHVDSVANPSEAKAAIARTRPDAVLLDLCFPDSAESGFTFLAELTHDHSPIPTLVLTDSESFADRIKVARLGGKGGVEKPISPGSILEAVAQLLKQSHLPAAKLLIVDDDPESLKFLSTLLAPWGFKLTLLDRPKYFWQALGESTPDLIIFDLEMPEFSGIDLCQVVRNDPRWQNLPVLFLSAHQDAYTLEQIFAAGADDYASKPIIGAELIARILTHLERTQTRRKQVEIDLLTGVSNRRQSVLELTQLLRKAEHEDQPLCFGLLDLDHFKQINDNCGHEIGDRVLSCFGKFLQQHFPNDIVARWGGEEFTIGLYGMRRTQAVERLTKFLEMLRQQKFPDAEGQLFQLAFSAGVAEFPHNGDNLQSLYQAADAVLYQAKVAGKNRIFASR